MTRINTNVASLRGLRNLGRANDLLDTSLARLSTGLKINSGKDNPSGLIASETLRSQISAIEQSIKNSNRANNVIATADSALGEISGLLNQVRGLVQEGLNSGALSQSEIEANQLQIDTALSAINRISSNTSFAGDKLIDGSKAFSTRVTSADAAKLGDFRINEAIFGASSTIVVDATIVTAAETADLRYAGGGLSAAATIEVAGSKGKQVLFFGNSSKVDDINSAVNDVSDITGVESTISTAAVAGTVDLLSAAVNSDVTFTDARTTTGTGVFSQAVDIVFVDPGQAGALGVAVTTDGNGDVTVTVNLANDGAAVTSTAASIATLINGNADANQYVTAAGEGAGGGIVDAIAATTLADGTDGTLTLTSSNYGSREFVELDVLAGTFATTLSDGTTSAARDSGTDVVVNINGQTAQTRGLNATIKTNALDATLTFDSASNSTGTNAKVTITGGGSLFQIGQDVSVAGQIGLGIEAVNTARLGGVSGKLYELGSGGGKSLLDVGAGVQGSSLVAIVEEAIDRVSTLRGRLGAVQKNVIETNTTSLGVALENISEARSQILDTDFAIETANLTKAQILSQAGLSVLGIANQNPSQVLSLLG
ncbi:MAG: flagellin [Planctomycetales bacterium]